MEKWEFKCPICGENIKTGYMIEVAKNHIGSTTDCPKCDGLLMIEEDLTVSDFENTLVDIYKEMGVEVSKEEATGTYIEF